MGYCEISCLLSLLSSFKSTYYIKQSILIIEYQVQSKCKSKLCTDKFVWHPSILYLMLKLKIMYFVGVDV